MLENLELHLNQVQSVHEFFTSMAVKNYFQQGGNTCLVTRVVSGSFASASSTDNSAT